MANSSELALVVDVGTSSVKAGIIDSRGRLKDWSREGVSIGPAADPGAELAGRWQRALKHIIRRLSRRRSITGIAISGNGPTIIAADSSGEALSPTVLWIDSRAANHAGGTSFFLPKIFLKWTPMVDSGANPIRHVINA